MIIRTIMVPFSKNELTEQGVASAKQYTSKHDKCENSSWFPIKQIMYRCIKLVILHIYSYL